MKAGLYLGRWGIRSSFCAVAVAALSCGSGTADDAEHHFHEGGGGGSGSAKACSVGETDGHFLLALSAKLAPKKPFVFDASVVTHSDAPGTIDLSLQPLLASDRMTPVGAAVTVKGLAVATDGSFSWDLGTLTIDKDANTVTPGSTLVTTVVLEGEACKKADFVCGTLSGNVSEPIDYPLVGSTFTMQRYDTTLPDPVINCQKNPAVY